MRNPSYEPLDEALDRLSDCGPELANGNFNHAPMVAEALCALGRPDAVMPWRDDRCRGLGALRHRDGFGRIRRRQLRRLGIDPVGVEGVLEKEAGVLDQSELGVLILRNEALQRQHPADFRQLA